MSVEAMSVVLHHSKAKGSSKLILLGIANHSGDGGAWPKVETLARYANVTERNAQKAIAQLCRLGELAVYVQGGGTARTADHKRPNRYEVLVACPATCDRSMNHRTVELPRAPAGLWNTPLSNPTPGVDTDTRGVSLATGEGVSLATPEPDKQPTRNYPGVTSNHRTRESPRCLRCRRSAADCIAYGCDETPPRYADQTGQTA